MPFTACHTHHQPNPHPNRSAAQQQQPTPSTGTRLAMHTHPPTHQQQTTGGSTDKVMTYHKEPTHPPQSERACHNKQSDPPHTHHKSMGIHGSERCSRPLSRSQTTTPHHAPPVPIQEQADAAGYPRPPHRPKPMQASWSEAPNHFSTRDTPRHLVDNIDQTRAVHPDGGGSDSSEPQQCVCLEPRNGVTGSCRHPPRAPPSLAGRWCGLFPHLPKTPPTPGHERSWSGCVLLRKEVIQPHLPVRLPCYDFVPIASPTFDHSLRKRLGRGLRVLPTFVT